MHIWSSIILFVHSLITETSFSIIDGVCFFSLSAFHAQLMQQLAWNKNLPVMRHRDTDLSVSYQLPLEHRPNKAAEEEPNFGDAKLLL